jgi:stringent starvation protein B
MNALESTSTRPYLIRALYDWCTDNGLTPYVAVQVDDSVQVPREYVKNGEIVLNISFDATSSLKLGNEFIEFKARFAGSAREIMVPVNRVIAIYARENGQGMAFPVPVRHARRTGRHAGRPRCPACRPPGRTTPTRRWCSWSRPSRRSAGPHDEPPKPPSGRGPRSSACEPSEHINPAQAGMQSLESRQADLAQW